MKKIIVLVIVSVAVLVSFRIYQGKSKSGKTAEKETFQASQVAVRAAVYGKFREEISITGGISAKEEIILYPKVAGKISQINVKEGDSVQKGAAVALVLRDDPGFDFAPSNIDSPIDGVVARVFLDPGATVTPAGVMGASMATPVVLVIDAATVQVKALVTEMDYSRIKTGMPAEVRMDSFPGRSFYAKVTRKSPVIDPVSRSGEIIIELENKDNLLSPGMFARISVTVSEYFAPAVPMEAVITREFVDYVFVYTGRKAVMREVRTGAISGSGTNSIVEIVKGISPKEMVITSGAFGLFDGQEVEIGDGPQ